MRTGRLASLALLGMILAVQVAWASPPVASYADPEGNYSAYPVMQSRPVVPAWGAPGPRAPVQVCPRCKHRGCICVPAAESFGYFPTLWRTWPFEPRPDQDFPQAIGAEPVPTPHGEPPKPMPVVDFNKMTPPAEEIPAPERPAEQPEPVAPPSPTWKAPSPAVPSLSAPSSAAPSSAVPSAPAPQLPEPPSAHDSILPPTTAAPQPLPSDEQIPTAQPAPAKKQTEFRATPGPLFPVESRNRSRKPVREAGLAGALVAPALPTALSETTPAMRMIPSAIEPDQPAPDRLARGIWDTRERALTVPIGYAEKLPAAGKPPVPEIRLTVGETSTPAPPATEFSGAAAPSASLQLEGFCPVELVEHGQTVAGNADWAVERDGQVFHCAGPEQQRRFWAHPERYLPAFGGVDPVLHRDRHEATAGRGDFWAIYDGRLYLFCGEATLAQFRHNPALYAERR